MTAVMESESQETVVRRLEADIAEVAGVLNAAHGRLVELASELIESDAWRGIGVKSPEHWLVWHAGLSPHRARQVIAIARRRSELPVTCDTLTRGELSVDQAVEVAKHVPGHNDAEGTSLAKVATVPQLRNTLSRYRFANPAAPSEAAESPELEAVRKGTVSMVHDGDRFRLYADAPLDDGALIESALAEAKDALFQQGRPGATWMDALLEACWLNQGPAIPPALAAKLVCDGVIQPLWETSGAPVNVGRAQRIVPDRTRRLVLDRDRGCIVPGCESRHHLEVHHLIAWSRGGRTDSANLACLCPFHHDALHRGELTITGDADHPEMLCFTDGLGRTMPPTVPPRPAQLTWDTGRPGPAGRRPRYRHPVGERIDNRCVHFTPPPTPTDQAPIRPHPPPT